MTTTRELIRQHLAALDANDLDTARRIMDELVARAATDLLLDAERYVYAEEIPFDL